MNIDHIREAASVIQERLGGSATLGIVLGSGLGALADEVSDPVHIPYGEIPHFPTSSVVGHAGRLVAGKLEGVSVIMMQGRVHAYEGYEREQVVFPVRVLHALGVRDLIITNAAGALNPEFRPGQIMLIEDHINFTGMNPLVGKNHDDLGPRFPDMSDAYGKDRRAIVEALAEKLEVKIQRGVYAGVMGPSYETPAEVRMLHRLGGDAVGMSTVAEVIAASHAGMNVTGMSVITNMGAGLSETALSHEEVTEAGLAVRDELVKLVKAVVVASQSW